MNRPVVATDERPRAMPAPHSSPAGLKALIAAVVTALALMVSIGASTAQALISTTWVQYDLRGLDYYSDTVDGVYGPNTRAAVTAFQRDNCLTVDGQYGSQTEAALLAKVKAVQAKAGTGQDGLYGSGTTAAVKSWQSAHGLTADGIAGPNTMKAMGITRAPCGGTTPTGTYGGTISRSEVLQRAQYWVNLNIPYSQSATYRDIDGSHTYRTDCSGFVSMAWHASPSGLGTYWTGNMNLITTPISKSQLQPGDALLNPNSHVVLFIRWYDSAHTRYVGQEEGSRGARESVIPYPYWSGTYTPVRYDKITG